MSALPRTTSITRRVTQNTPIDDAAVYPGDDEVAVLPDGDAIREALSILPIVAIEELI